MLSIDTISNNKEETLIGLKKRGFKDLKIIDKIIDRRETDPSDKSDWELHFDKKTWQNI